MLPAEPNAHNRWRGAGLSSTPPAEVAAMLEMTLHKGTAYLRQKQILVLQNSLSIPKPLPFPILFLAAAPCEYGHSRPAPKWQLRAS